MHWLSWTLGALLVGYAIVTGAGILIWAAGILLLIAGFVLYNRPAGKATRNTSSNASK